MLRDVHQRVVARMRRNGCSESLIRKATRYIDEPDRDVLVLGFARRFATYKRATLMFADPDRLKRLLTDPKRPVVVIFAGKAHPQDEPGQQLIKTIHDFSQHPDFIGHIILLENYDMALARKLVSGVDVWINNPEYPLEACGTSGQKAAINGVLNLSVLDGWWDEGYNGANGWAVVPHEPHYDPGYRYREEAADLINILESEVVPAFYERGTLGYSERWIRMCRESMWSILPQFNAQRMVLDYITKMYRPAIRGHEVLMRENARGARELAAWKRVVRDAWPNVSLRLIGEVPAAVSCDAPLSLEVEAALGGLGADDVRVELVLGERDEAGAFRVVSRHPFSPAGEAAGGRCRFGLSLPMLNCGLMHFKVCIYPYHPLLAHPYEMGCMKWL
ncbi:MAG: hypothetical protein KatS3mg121_0199 [Gammaproteobacteria bacterium]|nr:MAG: hypothetical protein KatS3mg121_0199 [Gammaproteobacteria bacterium]